MICKPQIIFSRRYWVLSQDTDDEKENKSNKIVEKEVSQKAPVMDMVI